jgi:ABC-type transport system involved in cytochrome c biogenesis permease component
MSHENPAAHRRRSRRRAWLLVIPIVAPLLSPLTNSRHPIVWGIPFFYWYQILCALVAITVIASVFVMGRERR